MKKRLDILLLERGFVKSRELGKKIIMSGQVYVNNQKEDKPGSLFKDQDVITVRGKKIEFVSRGGLKLSKAVKNFRIDLKDKVTMDIGASTGGFTDCMLQNGAKKVYAIDVGYGQLDWSLRTDERVVNLERTNFRHISLDKIPDTIDFFSVDVSFISIELILPVARNFLRQDCEAICLIKPQFEAGKDKVGKKGVVRDPEVHVQVIDRIKKFVLKNGFSVLGLDFSPIRGPQGNVEYLIHLKKQNLTDDFSNCDVNNLVDQANKI